MYDAFEEAAVRAADATSRLWDARCVSELERVEAGMRAEHLRAEQRALEEAGGEEDESETGDVPENYQLQPLEAARDGGESSSDTASKRSRAQRKAAKRVKAKGAAATDSGDSGSKAATGATAAWSAPQGN